MDREPMVQLNEAELLAGAFVGALRAAAAIASNRQNRARGIDTDGQIWTRHIEGALGEEAAAKALDRFWGGAAGARYRDTKATGGDVGQLQVRCRIAHPHDQEKRLIVQQRDTDAEDFLLVVGRLGVYRLVGWINAGDAKQRDDWIQNPGNYGPAWFVPQDSLIPVRLLPEVAPA